MAQSARLGFRLEWRGAEITDDIMRRAAQAVDDTMNEAVGLAKGFAPVRTGRLRDSIRRGAARINRRYVSGAFGAYGTPYGLFVELGTSRMKAHPYLRPAADIAFPKLRERLAGLAGGEAGSSSPLGASGGPDIGAALGVGLAIGGIAAAGIGTIAGIGAIARGLGGK